VRPESLNILWIGLKSHIRFALSEQSGEACARPDGLVVLIDGDGEKRLSRFAAVGQRKKLVSNFEVLFDLLNESRAFFRELERDDLPIRIVLWLAYPSLSLKKLYGLDRGEVLNTERRSDFIHPALRMPVEIEQHAGLESRDTKRLQAVTEKALETKNRF
jgi:hypothetical protein